MGRTSREKFASLERHLKHQSLFDDVDRELSRGRRRVLFPYVFAALVIFWLIVFAAVVAYASWVFGSIY